MPCDLTPEEVRKLDRANAVDTLTMISNPEAQLEYECNVPVASISSELRCQWLDDFYCHHRLRSFSNSFSSDELALLEEFDAFFDANDPLLPEKPNSIQVWLDDLTWRAIMTKAEETLRR